MQINQRSRLRYRIQAISFVLLFLTAIVLLAWLSNSYNIRSDWTANSRNSLSAATIELLKTIDGPVNIRSYQNEDPMMLQAVKEILQRYKRHKPDLEFRILNPDLEVELARTDNIGLYGQSVIIYRERQETIDTLSEQSISNALIRLARQRMPSVLFSSGHGERSPENSNNTGYSTLKQKLEEKGFDIRSINLLSEDIPETADILVIASPGHALLAGEVEKISTYLADGGQLLWLQDPGELPGLQAIAADLGIEFLNGVVVDDHPTLRKTLRIQHPAVVPVISYNPHAITEDMRYHTLFPIAAALGFADKTDWQGTPLLKTLPSSWVETDGFVLDVQYDPNKGDQAGPLDIGLALQRSTQQGRQRAVVIGDSDFLANTYVGAGANLTLALNIFNWLSEDDNLIAIEPKQAPDLKLDLDDSQVAIIGFGFLVIIPLALLAGGLTIWMRRRRR